ncbi:MAG: DUF4293 domain-containing protein [Bacteroidales bacterium]|nr:DUF4293 domain-containing protein [Bacteroidales bacterium]MBR6161831.1 DUF4293 domain-containing protein [Bacteroidales bacterium]
MIQRIQSIFLLVAAVIPIVMLFTPIGYVNTPDVQYVYNSLTLKMNVPEGHAVLRLYYVGFCLLLCSVLSLIALFTFKNRVRQTQIVSICMIVYLVTLMLMLWVCPDVVFKKFFTLKETTYDFQFANKVVLLILVCVEAACLYLANKFIKKDEALVRAADRLR